MQFNYKKNKNMYIDLCMMSQSGGVKKSDNIAMTQMTSGELRKHFEDIQNKLKNKNIQMTETEIRRINTYIADMKRIEDAIATDEKKQGAQYNKLLYDMELKKEIIKNINNIAIPPDLQDIIKTYAV